LSWCGSGAPDCLISQAQSAQHRQDCAGLRFVVKQISENRPGTIDDGSGIDKPWLPMRIVGIGDSPQSIEDGPKPFFVRTLREDRTGVTHGTNVLLC
jgi:hypothetical protein